jgi:hypothetical protein
MSECISGIVWDYLDFLTIGFKTPLGRVFCGSSMWTNNGLFIRT